MPDRPVARQASRCMDCGTPFCHGSCPVHNLIPEWNMLVIDVDWRRAWEQLDSTNNFPEFTGRLCPAPCEDACTLSLEGQPVSIKSIEVAIAERAWQKGWVQPKHPKQKLWQQVTVVGSGPAGLACAQLLARAGYRVTVLEKADRLGGLLRYGIPDFRLQKQILDRRLAQLEAEGVNFQTGVHAGVKLDSNDLRSSADAVVLACGSEKPRNVPVPGRNLKGIHYALPYLKQQNQRVTGDDIDPEDAILATGKDVVVIGGGDTGCDCVGTAIRQHAKHVTQVQYHERPPPHADVLQHWPEAMPVLHGTDTEAEGCWRVWAWDTIAFEEQDGVVASILMQRLKWTKRADGSWDKQLHHEQAWRLPAQLVLLAIGYAHPNHEDLLNQMGLEFDTRGNVLANDEDYQTNIPGVFACGDMRRGQSLLVWAIREGRQCAHAVDDWLSGDSELPRI